MKMFEVGAHEVWMAALPLREGFVARLPMIFAATGDKYWVLKQPVPGTARVVRVRTEIDAENDSVVQVQAGL